MKADYDVLLKEVFTKAVKRFKIASKCKPIGDGAVAGFVRHRGKLFHIVVSKVDEDKEAGESQ